MNPFALHRQPPRPPTKSTVGEANRANRPQRAADEKWYPDHAVFNATKDQLKAMPQF